MMSWAATCGASPVPWKVRIVISWSERSEYAGPDEDVDDRLRIAVLCDQKALSLHQFVRGERRRDPVSTEFPGHAVRGGHGRPRRDRVRHRRGPLVPIDPRRQTDLHDRRCGRKGVVKALRVAPGLNLVGPLS